MNKTRHYMRILLLVLLLGGMGSEAWAQSPAAPTDLTVSDIKLTTATLSWKENGTATSWVVAYQVDGAGSFTEVNVTTNPYTLTGLTANTAYTVKVRAVVTGESDTYSDWTAEKSFKTAREVKVVYHVITLPFSDESTDNIAYRIEAIKTRPLDALSTDKVMLPSDLKSPLMKDEAYSYYKKTAVTQYGLKKIFPGNESKFYYYEFTGAALGKNAIVGDADEVDGKFHIYVKYDWADPNKRTDYGNELDLTGHKSYNIEFRTSAGNWFYAFNMDNDRGNRGQSVPAEYLNSLEDLSSDDIVRIKQPARNKYNFYFKWKLTNDDPYNIIIKTANDTGIDYTEDGYKKDNAGAHLYGSLESSSKIRSNWVTNEVNKIYYDKSAKNWESNPGWFRGTAKGTHDTWGRNGKDNGVVNHLYFSFSLLNRSTASEGDYTLAASWVEVDGDDWVPNGSGQYLLMQHDPVHDLPYAGPKFLDFTATDQVLLHEIREYSYNVKTPFYPAAGTDFEKKEHTVSATFKMSDYAAESKLTDFVPEALKRKYTSIDGAYKEAALTTPMTYFKDAIAKNKEDVIKRNEIIPVWLKYSVLPSKSFDTYNTDTPFAELKWYNIYVNKEEKYTTWYDKTDSNKFNTSEGSSGHTKYSHESHFAFIGDPYELRVVNRLASEDASNAQQYLKLNDATIKNPLQCGTNEAHYRAVPAGTILTIGNTYYTTINSSHPQFTDAVDVGDGYYVRKYVGCVANGSNYYEKKFSINPVPNGELTEGNKYYESATGDKPFIYNKTTMGSLVANGTNYYEAIIHYDPVASGNLIVGNTYYTSAGGDGAFPYNYVKSGDDGITYYEKKFDATWEIIYDNNSGDYAGCFRLRQFNTYGASVTIGWDTSTDKRPLKGDNSDQFTEARLSVKKLPMMEYTYYIVDSNNRIAVMATKEQITGTALNYDAIPDTIRSPFLKKLSAGKKLTFRTYKTENLSVLGVGKTVNLTGGDFEEIPSANSDMSKTYRNHIFVSYVPADLTALAVNPLDDNDAHKFYVILNNEYIYYDSSTGKINSATTIPSTNLEYYQWVLGGGDPYALSIRNLGVNKYVTIADGTDTDTDPDWADGTISWSNAAPASRFILKSSSRESTYEVMAATGVVLGADNKIDLGHSIDAIQNYYNIGRVKNNATNTVVVRMYSNVEYQAGNAELRFELRPITATEITYHLIDKFNKDLLQATSRQADEEAPLFPSQYWSPLVAKYYYYKDDNFEVGAGEDKTAGTADDIYTLKSGQTELSTIKQLKDLGKTDIYVLYDANDLVDMSHTTMYLLKYHNGEKFYQENGSDALLSAAQYADENISKAVYPYCNGDGNFNIYGQYQYDVQQEGAASTRTRWAWYVQSSTNDPYHVKILSRQTETYKGLERSAYFSTMQPAGYDDVVTMLVWPNISGVMSTDYMVLGSEHNYQLVTSYKIEKKVDKNNDGDTTDDGETTKERYVVDSFEQYWKTYDLIRRKVLKQGSTDYPANASDPADVPDAPCLITGFTSNRTYLKTKMGWHAYNKMAYAKRWNGYNKDGETKKGWESREHWFQTVSMGAGYFDLIPTTIDAALILLDQHGWEIIRKPLPNGPDDPNKDKKYEVLRQWDSPMVKEYIFWATAKKRSGYHQYYGLDKRIGGSDFSSTSLTNLPPWGSENVLDSKGNHQDEYVTYIVKEEYAQSYNPQSEKGAEFLIRQGNSLANKTGSVVDRITVNGTAGASQYIIDHIGSLGNELWYVKPNVDIDREMGYPATHPDWKDNPNAYEDDNYKNKQVAEIIVGSSDDATVKKYGHFSFSNGFDPYNIQISSYSGAKYFTLSMTSAKVEEGMNVGNYSGTGGSTALKLADKNTSPVAGTSYDNGNWAMTNQTFMAVQDADGNMQLMPRFDHNLRLRNFQTLVTPTAEAEAPTKLLETQTQLYRPFVYNYYIVDNDGRESLRYQSGGDLVPQTPNHLKSPLAKEFKYYMGLTYNSVTHLYTEVANKLDISNKEITQSLAGAGLTTPLVTTANPVYVRYAYDENADPLSILQGKWLTMQLNEKDVLYNHEVSGPEGINTATKPTSSEDLATAKLWHWKFLRKPYNSPDPYAVQVFNRNRPQEDKPMRSETLADGTVLATNGTSNFQRFALLSHEDGGYALAVAGTEYATDFYFLNGAGLTLGSPTSATTALESGFNGSSGIFDEKKSQIRLTDDIQDNYTYEVYTNGSVKAIDAVQGYSEAHDNNFEPKLPDEIRSPLLNFDQFRYYEAQEDMDDEGKELKHLYGLYDDKVYVRYTYDPNKSEYKVPNEIDATGTHVARHTKSNDAPLRLDGKLPYNIFWYNKNIMKNNSDAVVGETKTDLQATAAYEWNLEGDDPYAIKIKSVGASTEGTPIYINASGTLSETAQTFMLLPKDGYEYGVLAVTGTKANKMTMVDNADEDPLSIATTDNPEHFIIFALGTLKVVYRLVISNINESQDIPSRTNGTDATYTWNSEDKCFGTDWTTADKETIPGTSMRDLSNDTYMLGSKEDYPDFEGLSKSKLRYCIDVGRISLGDTLTVPKEFYRPNVVYSFYIHGIEGGTDGTGLNNRFKGMEITSKKMGVDLKLIGTTIYIDLVYTFNGSLKTNSGEGFVKDISENKWYTLETMINNKPWLAQYTNAWGFELKEGRGSHYTNDFLWTPVGDPYGFQLFNRYMDVNSGNDNRGEKNKVITTDKYYQYYTAGEATAYNAALPGALNSTDALTEEQAIAYNTAIQPAIGKNAGYILSADEANAYNAKLAGAKKKGDIINESTAPDFGNGLQIVMGDYTEHTGQATNRTVIPGHGARFLSPADIKAKSIYELLESTTPGYFYFHPVANTKEQTQFYFNPVWADDDGDDVDNRLVRLSTTPAEFTFVLSKELMKPYFDRAGYVGGLKKEVYDELEENNFANDNPKKNLLKNMIDEDAEPSFAQLMAAQEIVYDFKNTVAFETGYYRLHSPLGISDIDPVRYVSGYTHKIEYDLDGDGDPLENDAIPMHFYEENSERVRPFVDFKNGGFTESPATRGDINIPPVERDPASIFYFEKIFDNPNNPAYDRYNLTYMSTQGLYVRGTVAKGTEEGGSSHRAKAVMTTETPPQGNFTLYPDPLTPKEEGEEGYAAYAAYAASPIYFPPVNKPLPLFIMDLGGGVLLIHDQKTENGRGLLKYLSYDHSNDGPGESTIYDMKMTHYTHTDHAKFCMQPVQKAATKGVNEMGLKYTSTDYTLNNGGDKYYYTTFCAPYDVLLTDEKAIAYICEVWDTEMLHLRKVSRYNTVENGCPDEKYVGSKQFVPAGTPVIIRTPNSTVTMALPTTEPSKTLAAYYETKNIFSGVYLEQLLASGSVVYVFGLPFESPTNVKEHNKSTGEITIELPTLADDGVGFYINANYNRETGGSTGEWTRNNRCVYSNKIYIRDPQVSTSRQTRSPEFIPVVFDDDDEEEDEPIEESLLQRPHDNRVYDLLGRCVASGEEVVNGTWRHKVASGIYILNGRKIYVK